MVRSTRVLTRTSTPPAENSPLSLKKPPFLLLLCITVLHPFGNNHQLPQLLIRQPRPWASSRTRSALETVAIPRDCCKRRLNGIFMALWQRFPYLRRTAGKKKSKQISPGMKNCMDQLQNENPSPRLMKSTNELMLARLKLNNISRF